MSAKLETSAVLKGVTVTFTPEQFVWLKTMLLNSTGYTGLPNTIYDKFDKIGSPCIGVSTLKELMSHGPHLSSEASKTIKHLAKQWEDSFNE